MKRRAFLTGAATLAAVPFLPAIPAAAEPAVAMFGGATYFMTNEGFWYIVGSAAPTMLRFSVMQDPTTWSVSTQSETYVFDADTDSWSEATPPEGLNP